MNGNGTYFVIANRTEKGRLAQPQSHGEFVHSMLARATEKLGAAPNLVRCHPNDREDLARALTDLKVEIGTNVQPNEFWLGHERESTAAAAKAPA